ncbi:MAG: ABC transporter ATP-binding protein [Gammaproteobacteria bacterium]|nr:ABC transporter ATP-binding protein [Gammaproteobacteria bacterium]
MQALKIENLSMIYKNKCHALKDVSLSINQGDFFSLLGPNGAGKSTLINIVCGLLKKTNGSVKVFDKSIDTDSYSIKQDIGLVPQEHNFNLIETPSEILMNQAGFHGIKRKLAKKVAEKQLACLDILHKKDVRARELSGGMKRRLMIARALMTEPKLLLLDEPTAGVDIEARHSLWQYLQKINQQGTTIILTTHHLEEAEYLCNKFAIINHGNIVENTTMNDLFNVEVEEDIIISTKNKLPDNIHLHEFTYRRLGDFSLEVHLKVNQNVSQVFQALMSNNVVVSGIRNKTNRLEAVFLALTNSKQPEEVVL